MYFPLMPLTPQPFGTISIALSTVVLLAYLFLSAPATGAPSGDVVTAGFLSDSSKTALFLPLDRIKVTVVDLTRSLPAVPREDSFFMEVANALLQYEVAQRFAVAASDRADSAAGAEASPLRLFRSQVVAVVDSPTRVADLIRSLADQCSVDFIVLPLDASVTERISRKRGWRNAGSGPSYERPLECLAEATITVRVWDRAGKVVYSRMSAGESRKPLLYSFFKHESAKNEGLVTFSRNIFAPPLIRALNRAVTGLFPQKRSSPVRGRRN